MPRFTYTICHDSDEYTALSSGVVEAVDMATAYDHVEFMYPIEGGYILTVRPAPDNYLEP
jgi:hypothetical protein